MDRESMQLLSLRLSRALEDIGVSRYMRTRRRRTWLMRETIGRITSELQGDGFTLYQIGSQTEGTTTLGMESDLDSLFCYGNMPVILDWGEWKQGMRTLLVVKTEHSRPQHCWLQKVRPDLPLPETNVRESSDMMDSEGRVLRVNTQIEYSERLGQQSQTGEIVQHGPSKSWNESNDMVWAFHCASLPEECKFLFHRPRPGHWPRHDTLAQARQTGVFLVPQGYTEDPSRPIRCKSTTFHVPQKYPFYPHSKREWRFSTSLMERLLMFNMSTVQHKVYVFLKILRKSNIKLIVDDRFSTFHMKTAMLFTIETYPPDIWREDNLVQCVIYCLTTLLRWLKIKNCPHYTISGVNLFTGKLFKHEQNKLHSMIAAIMHSHFQPMFLIEIDNLGKRINPVCCFENTTDLESRFELNKVQVADLFKWYVYDACEGFDLNDAADAEEKINAYLQSLLSKHDNYKELEHESTSLLIPQLCGRLACIQASKCTYCNQPITQNIIHLFRLSFDFDLLSKRLKFASMLYCSGQYEAATNSLICCKGLLGPEVWQCCGCEGREQTHPSNEFMEKAINTSFKDMLQKYTGIDVLFTSQEMNCVPHHLRYEMFRTIGEEDWQQRHPDGFFTWMDHVVIDCIPFLHYLQYLTHRQLNQHQSKLEALNNLNSYISSNEDHGHIDTAWNMLGHCWELENRLDLAWICYTQSLEIYPRNNAANWHVARMVHNQLNG
ncbi:uncharacterized protein LOC128219616 [Mya arenaria]|uniref:uncharacterized protein LOC128219616 n=1 Tax=Mya arenaria TaxID=6604 RepID=UPI0022E0E1EB|nr:uncharacterized protein LOC128219616 [Mya arenaria]XP_052783457.1 uncharacterized protein LOC128219616 [Mya arenaria]